jgi:hypothetical protein
MSSQKKTFGLVHALTFKMKAIRMESVIQWIECGRCQKWRIIPPMPDGSEELIPDVWFCEMNRDPLHNNCEAPEEEYKAPEVPIMPLLPIIPPNMNRIPRPAKANDPDSIRAKLKLLSDEDLQAAYDSIDLERVFREEFPGTLDTARSTQFHPEVVHPRGFGKQKPSSSRKEFDSNAAFYEIHRLEQYGKTIFPQEIAVALTSDSR